jgi:hypothetical protein
MRRILALAGFAFVVLMTGCVRSAHPIYMKEDLTFDPGLLGTWFEKDGKDIWIFEQAGDNAYKLMHLEDGEEAKSAIFDARLVQVGDQQYLDLFPEEPEIKSGFYKIHLVPVHSFVRLSLQRDSLRMSALDYDWLRKKIAARELDLPHVVVDGDIILTGGPREIQAFLIGIAEEKSAFCDPNELQRRN